MHLSRQIFRRRLNAFLEIAEDEGFLQLIWATDALQSGFEHAAAPYLANRYPADAVTTDLTSKMFFYKWQHETLVNELLTVPKRKKPKRGRQRQLVINNFDNIIAITNVLRDLENAEDFHRVNGKSIWREMARIANREFDWQRGYFNLPQFYRNAFVYGQGECAAYFEARHGITIDEFSLVGFAIYTGLVRGPVLSRPFDLAKLGISLSIIDRSLALIARPIKEMRALALAERDAVYPTAYRASVLRRFPCITFGNNNERLRSPLPQLILERVTGGVFYDVINGGGAVRRDYGRRFEDYCIRYLRAMLPAIDWRPEEKYRVKANQHDTPDIIVAVGGKLSLVVECKATRMGYDAKFGDGDERGWEDLVKAVFQLWRFFSHVRRGLTRFEIEADLVGCVLTLDNWLLMANELQAGVIASACSLAAEKDRNILEEDRRPIAFFSITDLEATLTKATASSFSQATRRCARPDRYGWMFSTVHDEFKDANQPARNYPFRDDVTRLLPWHRMLGEMA